MVPNFLHLLRIQHSCGQDSDQSQGSVEPPISHSIPSAYGVKTSPLSRTPQQRVAGFFSTMSPSDRTPGSPAIPAWSEHSP